MQGTQAQSLNIRYIPSDLSFVDTLASGLLKMSAGDQLTLSAMTVLLPNRRACRSLQDAFLRLAGAESAAILLPRLQPIGDIDEEDLTVLAPGLLGGALEIPPAVPPLRREMMLARMILAAGRLGGDRPRLDQALLLSRSLCSFLDEVEIEGVSLDGLDRLVSDELARHWQITLDFFDLLRRQWPAILEAEGAIDPMDRRNRLLEAQARLWREHPPETPVIVAGSTGSIPATQRLMASVAALGHGAVILPGLDVGASDEDWAAIEMDPSHPQFGMAQLLRQLKVPRQSARPWVGVAESAPSARQRMVAWALAPASRTDLWQARQIDENEKAQAWSGIERIDCRNEQEEALIVALALRQHLESAGKGSAALVTPDRNLAQRVAGELRRWSIDIDDSAGKKLSRWPAGAFLLALAQAAAEEWAPVALLSFLKHPLCAGGWRLGTMQRFAEELDRQVLRGPRPQAGWDGIDAAILSLARRRGSFEPGAMREELRSLSRRAADLDDWTREIAPLQRLQSLTLAAERFAESDEATGPERLYAGEAGEALAQLIAGALEALHGMPACDAHSFGALLHELLANVDVRPRFGKHPRLFIWGPLEARLQQVDLMILGGMNEGAWPADDGDDPWMSRPMRRQFGLPALERRVGLAAHDFQQCLGAKRVILTRAQRVDGQPTVPSRWLLRLDALRACLNLPSLAAGSQLRSLAWQIDDAGPAVPCQRPSPRPGARWRPRRLSVTRIEAWRRDPYAIYASAILGLWKLDPLDQDPGAAELGIIIHKALDAYVSTHGVNPPVDRLTALLAIGKDGFGELMERPQVWAFWWPRFERIARWFLEEERKRRPSIATSYTEVNAHATVKGGPLSFDLTARADRIDRYRDGGLAIIDYKTGQAPLDRDIRLGYAPQLALEAMLARMGAFENIAPGAKIAELMHWRLSGGKVAGEILYPKLGGAPIEPDLLADQAEAGLQRLLEYYEGPDASYPALPDLRYGPAFNDYEHLERALEWSGSEGT